MGLQVLHESGGKHLADSIQVYGTEDFLSLNYLELTSEYKICRKQE